MLYALLQAAAAPGPADRVRQVVEGFSDYLLDYALALAAVGALAMALIEAGKKLLDSRTRFHAKRWTGWMLKSGNGQVDLADRRVAYTDLIQLCTGVTKAEADDSASALVDNSGSLPPWNGWNRAASHAVFCLETSRMMGAIQEAGDIALAAPSRHGSLFKLITAGADQRDVIVWVDKKRPDGKDADVKDQADAFARLRQVFKRKLDAFQLYTEQRWATWNQLWANLLGAAIMALALGSSDLELSLPGFLLLSAFGGILSPIAKDLVAALRRGRNG